MRIEPGLGSPKKLHCSFSEKTAMQFFFLRRSFLQVMPALSGSCWGPLGAHFGAAVAAAEPSLGIRGAWCQAIVKAIGKTCPPGRPLPGGASKVSPRGPLCGVFGVLAGTLGAVFGLVLAPFWASLGRIPSSCDIEV